VGARVEKIFTYGPGRWMIRNTKSDASQEPDRHCRRLPGKKVHLGLKGAMKCASCLDYNSGMAWQILIATSPNVC
jgi:hypothetical protein